jgi:hypothetical protein
MTGGVKDTKCYGSLNVQPSSGYRLVQLVAFIHLVAGML